MYKTRKSIISLLMAMVMMVAFCIPAMAAESQPIPFGTESTELQQPQLRFPASVGISAVRVYPANLNEGVYYNDSYSYGYPSGSEQICNVTINSATRNLYNSEGCNGWYVQVDANTNGAKRYELSVNGSLVGSGSLYYTATTFSFPVSGFMTSMNWKIVCYDSTSQGKPIWGQIYS
ncbi:MAG: hypothetical protein RR413_05745 [Christensenellaceae bacterium]